MFDICIIGGGAAGITAAITAKKENEKLSVCILEKNDSLGKKLLATGNGKCNLSNLKCGKYRSILSFFEGIGITTRVDADGRIYPYSEEAKEVVDCLKISIKALNIKTKCRTIVTRIIKTHENPQSDNEVFEIFAEKEIIFAKKILIAVGGKAGPEFGCSGDGYKWAKGFGHKVIKTKPILTGIECLGYDGNNIDFGKLAGIRAKANSSLYFKNNLLFSENGEVQFTKDGISGICIFNMTRFLNIPDGKSLENGFEDYIISINFLPDNNISIKEILTDRREFKNFIARDLLRSIVKEGLAFDVLKRAGINPEKPAAKLTDAEITHITAILKDWRVGVKSLKGWKMAQATKGGVDLEEINMETMESKLVDNLFFAGEVVDFDGPCGGYNLENAWENGIKAGKAMAKN